MRLVRLLLVAIAVAFGCETACAEATETTVHVVPSDDSAVLDAARAKVAAGDTRGAIAGLEPYTADHPNDTAAARLLGDLYFRVPDYARAERVWKRILALQPDDKETHNRLGSLYSAQDRVDEAITEFQRSLPSRGGVAGLVALHKRLGDLPQWLAKEQATADEHPLDPIPWSELGMIRRSLRQYDAALAAYSHVVAMRPASCAAQVDVANALVDLGRVDPAIDHLQKCLKSDGSYYPAVVNLGEAYLEKKDVSGARPYFDRALTLRPNGNEALVDIGYILDLRGDWKGAVVYYNRAIAADPLRPEAYIDLGFDYNEHRLFAQAEAAYLKGISVAPDEGRLHYMLAVTYNLQGKIPLARQQYRLAIDSAEPLVVRAAKNELALLPGGP
jgi:tetratricopeptide (TPR) repeat protein